MPGSRGGAVLWRRDHQVRDLSRLAVRTVSSGNNPRPLQCTALLWSRPARGKLRPDRKSGHPRPPTYAELYSRVALSCIKTRSAVAAQPLGERIELRVADFRSVEGRHRASRSLSDHQLERGRILVSADRGTDLAGFMAVAAARSPDRIRRLHRRRGHCRRQRQQGDHRSIPDLPGAMMPSGSNARLMRRLTSRSAGPWISAAWSM